MLRFLLPIALISTARCTENKFFSAATPAQIKFAIENNYDDTGPGSVGTEYAYNTYKTLDEALIGYIDDPDTKLPDHEKARAIALLYDKNKNNHNPVPNAVDPNDVSNYNPPTRKPNYVFFGSRFSVLQPKKQYEVTGKPLPLKWSQKIIHPYPKPIYYNRNHMTKLSPEYQYRRHYTGNVWGPHN